MINFDSFGDRTENPDLLIVHGLFGSARNWRAIARNLSSDRQVHVVDMRNHGDSFWDDDHSYPAMADDLKSVIEHIGAPMDVLGHSMGGKASMVLSLQNPELVHRLMVIDIAPVAYEHDQVSNVEIMQSLDLNSITRRSEADQILSASLPEAAVRAFFLQSLSDHPWSVSTGRIRNHRWGGALGSCRSNPRIFRDNQIVLKQLTACWCILSMHRHALQKGLFRLIIQVNDTPQINR